MPKDNESIPFVTDEPLAPSEPPGFAHDQMVRCDECLRANPPTRLNCFYCGAALPLDERSASLVKPTLKPIEGQALGYNIIFLPQSPEEPTREATKEASDLLRLEESHFDRLISLGAPMPLARTATLEEASLVHTRLAALGLESNVVSDSDLAIKDSPPVRVRAIDISETSLTPKNISTGDSAQILWSQFVLLVTGRLATQRVEMRERKARRGENEILDASKFFTDELVMDLYTDQDNFRIMANGFDFSCLSKRKLTVAENFSLLVDVFRKQAPHVEIDDLYNRCRQSLDEVWPAEQQSDSSGWRRERAGKYSIGAILESSNEAQFTRYSRLRHFLKTKATTGIR